MSPLKPLVFCMTLALFAAAPVSNDAFAGAWDSAHLFDNPSKTVQTLIVTGNFTKPRFIAEIARKETKTPYLLFPAPGDNRIFFNPGGKGPALEIRESDIGRFVEFIGPKQIIVLGDSRFVPPNYVADLGAKCDIQVIADNNWYTNATTLGNMIDCKILPKKYLNALAKYEAVNPPDEKKPVPAPVATPDQGNAPLTAEQSLETMILMPPSKGVDEPVLLVPQELPAKRK